MPRYSYTAIAKRTYPTLAEARTAVEKANKLDSAQRDTRDLMAILMAMVENSPRIAGDVDTRRAALAAFTWKLAPYDTADAERAALAERRMRPMISQLMGWWVDCPLYGAMVVEQDWVDDPATAPFRRPVAIKRYTQTEIERTSADPQQLQLLADDTKLLRTPITDKPPGSMLAVCDAGLKPGGLLRSLLWHELLRNEMLQEQAGFLRLIKGLVIGTFKEWASDEDKETLDTALGNLTTNQAAVLSESLGVDYKSVVNYLGATSFKDFIEAAEDAASILILGQANTTRLPSSGGSRAALQVLDLIRADKLWYDLSGFTELMQHQLLLQDAQLNLSPTLSEAPWRFMLAADEQENVEANARVITDALAAGLPLLRAEAYRRIGYTPPIDGDDVIEPTTKPAMPGF